METASGTRFPDHGARLCRYSSVSTTHGDGSAEVTSMWLVFCRPSDVGNEGRTMTGPVQTRPGFPGGSAGPAAKAGQAWGLSRDSPTFGRSGRARDLFWPFPQLALMNLEAKVRVG